MTDIETDTNTPDTMEVEESLRHAMEELHPEPDLPAEDLFAVDGLGHMPELQRPLRTKDGSVKP